MPVGGSGACLDYLRIFADTLQIKKKNNHDYIRPATQRVGARASAEGVSLTSIARPFS